MDHQTPNNTKDKRWYNNTTTNNNNNLPPLLSSRRNITDRTAATPQFRSMETGSRSIPLRQYADHPTLKHGQEATSTTTPFKKSARLNYKHSSELQTVNNNPIAEKKSLIQQQTIPIVPEFRPINIKTTWENPILRPIPNYYPLESSTKSFHENDMQRVLSNLSEAFRVFGIQAKYFESPAGAALLTPELVEIHVCLWKATNDKKIYVELQRRRGDAITFHRYSRSILGAAASCGDSSFEKASSQNELQYLRGAAKLFQRELPRCDEGSSDVESLQSIELAADLLQKDRFDARILGMESLSILTNPRKTCWNTALLASRAVLFGDKNENHAFGVIHEFILNIVQNRCIPDDEDSGMQDSFLMGYDSDDDEEDYFSMKGTEDDRYGEKSSEHNATMHAFVNYGLKIISSALQILTTSLDAESKSVTLLDPRTVVENFLQRSLEFSPKQDILKTFLNEVGCAESKPHNACLAAKSLKIMCHFSSAARFRMKTLHGFETVTCAEEIGKVTNVRLEDVCGQLQQVLARS